MWDEVIKGRFFRPTVHSFRQLFSQFYCQWKGSLSQSVRPGACFSKVPKPFGRISGDIILFVSSKRRRLEPRNFAVIFIYIPFTTYEKTSFTEQAGRSFTNGFSGPKSSRDFRETGPRTSRSLGQLTSQLANEVTDLLHIHPSQYWARVVHSSINRSIGQLVIVCHSYQ